MKTIIFISLILLTACHSPGKLRDQYLPNYVCGKFNNAEAPLKEAICQDMPNKSFTNSRNAVWYLLNLATIQFAKGDVNNAISTYQLAIEALDYYSQKSSDDLSAQMLLEDQFCGFSGAPFEKSLSRIYFALALLQKGDLNNAEALLRRAENLNQTNNLGRLLFATLLEKRGDLSNAKILFKQAGLSCEEQSPHKATVLVVCHNGNAPSKYSTMAPASGSCLLTLELLLQNERRPVALSSLPGIPVPTPFRWKGGESIPTKAILADEMKFLTPVYNVDQESLSAIEKETPAIIARGVARYLVRRSCIYVANEQNESLGSLADIGCLIANAMTEADTRAWDTLPASIDIARFDVEPGEYPLCIQVGNKSYQKTLHLKTGELRVINIFNLHPGITFL